MPDAFPDLRGLCCGVYHDGGRGETDPVTREPRYDCWGLTMAVHRAFGIVLPDFVQPAEDAPAVAGTFAAEITSGRWQRIAEPETPCVVAMRHRLVPEAVSHFGTYVGGGRVVHIAKAIGAVRVDSLYDVAFARRIAGYWRRA